MKQKQFCFSKNEQKEENVGRIGCGIMETLGK
jgi:hypothetical protein